MTPLDLNLFDSLIDRLDMAATAGGSLNPVPWIIKNTSDPKNPRKHWSFAGHEYQLGILEDPAPHRVIMKASQIGVSEISVRALLAMTGKMSGEHFIYVLPSSKFASKFTSSRMDPVIDSSDRLKRIVSKSIDSTEIKQIGSCFVHIGGAQKESQAISIPARGLFIDEQTFCDPDVLSVYQSRLGHNLPGTEILYEFSTPLFPNMGIHLQHELGTKFIYMAYHDACGHWVEVDSLKHIVLPGYDNHLSELIREDLELPYVHPSQAWVKCEKCGSKISIENLADPAKRAWVAHHPDKDIHSFYADALVAPTINPPSKVLSKLRVYKKTDRWIQYAIGQPYESASSQITKAAREAAFTVTPIKPLNGNGVYGACLGMDVGKISHITAGKRVNGILEVFHMETVKQGGDNELGDQFIKNFRAFNCNKGVIDSAPDVSICKYVQNRTTYNSVFGSYFIRSRGRASLDFFAVDEMEGLVKVQRTQAIDEFVSEFNSGKIRLPKGLPFMEEVKEHLERPKRIEHEDAVGEDSAIWVSKGADHWAFSLVYLWLATKMVEEEGFVFPISSGSAIVSKVRLKTN